MSRPPKPNFERYSKPPETLTVEESEKLLTTLRNDRAAGFAAWKYLRNYTMALLMLDAGLRVGEVVRLQISDLLFDCQPIKAIDLSNKKAEKKCERIIPLTTRIVETLGKMRELVWTATQWPDNAYAFFDNDTQTHLTTRQVQRIIGQASLAAFGRAIHPHVLRHTFATRLMRVTSMSVVQQLLGHKHINSTQVYMHANGDDCKKAIEKMNINT
jgi:integrase/recombinase XerC